ncbi:IMPACT family protein [Algoriphagus namhaensis]|uniref:IMPACT family protein n=1 Tax=Algoriphagus namhaensis TaxID=915353 RepID=A0ABV8ARS8_9BACT
MSDVEEDSDHEDSFLTIGFESSSLFKDRNSKFHGYAFPVQNEEEIKARLDQLRKQFYDARHHCYAYIIGRNQEYFRAVDDGEPNHSAGDPILGQIRSFGLTNCLVVVIRYFGGTKLGVSGLINAYKTAAQLALESNEIIREYVMSQVKIKFEYPQMNDVMKLVKAYDLTIVSQELHLDCRMVLSFREGLEGLVLETLEQIGGLEILNS